jgi:hypothetical protein
MLKSTTSPEQIQLGLCEPPEPVYLYVGQTEVNGETSLWYRYDCDAQKQHPVKQRGLTGYISELRVTVKEFKGRENSKLDVVVHADQLYVIRSGLETNFTKTLLLALSTVPDFHQPLTIAVVAGEENVVFGRVYDAIALTRFKADWKPDTDWLNLISQLQVRLGQAAVAQEVPSIQPASAASPVPLAQGEETLPNAERVKAVRALTGHSTDAVRAILAHNFGTEHPKHLDAKQCELLIEILVSGWYETLRSPEPFNRNAYRFIMHQLQRKGLSETEALQAWMAECQKINTPAEA